MFCSVLYCISLELLHQFHFYTISLTLTALRKATDEPAFKQLCPNNKPISGDFVTVVNNIRCFKREVVIFMNYDPVLHSVTGCCFVIHSCQ